VYEFASILCFYISVFYLLHRFSLYFRYLETLRGVNIMTSV